MEEKDKQVLRETLLDVVEASLAAQLRAVRGLRSGKTAAVRTARGKGRSQLDLAEDILRRAGKELHVGDIIERIARVHHVEIDRESLVSALTKKVERSVRFMRTAPNTFALRR